MSSSPSPSFSSPLLDTYSVDTVTSLRWVADKVSFPRVLCQTSILSMDVLQNSITHGGEVVGCLLSQGTSASIGIIASTWGEWLPALQFVPIQPTWVWILDNFWEKILKRLYPRVVFISGLTSPLPPVDVLLLSRVTLGQCNISLEHCPFSLILSTA